MRIGEIARRTGLSVDTIRYYESVGLIADAPRTRAGYRRFDQDALERLRFVQRARGLGFGLEEIRQLLALSSEQAADASRARHQAQAKLEDIEQKLADLTRMRAALRKLVAACTGDGLPTTRCPILEALQQTKGQP